MPENVQELVRHRGAVQNTEDPRLPPEPSRSQKAWMVCQTAQQPIGHQYQAVKAARDAGYGDRSLLTSGITYQTPLICPLGDLE